MTDYSQYKYSHTLQVLEGQYDNDIDPRNYAKYLLTMNEASSLKQCINIYNTVYKKYCKLFDLGWSGHKDIDEDLARCLNDNIVRLFKATQNATYRDMLVSLCNLRQCAEIEDYQNELIASVRQVCVIGTVPHEIVNKIMKAQKQYYEGMYSLHYDYLQPGTNGYKRVVCEIEDSLDVLKEHGYVKCASDYEFRDRVIEKNDILVYSLTAVILIALIFCSGGLLLLALPIIGFWAILKG